MDYDALRRQRAQPKGPVTGFSGCIHGSRRSPANALIALRASPEWRLALAILALAPISVYAVFWPGLVSWDTRQIMAEARHGPIVDWWTALGTLGLRLWFGLGLGQGSLWALLIIAAVAGLFGCARVALRPVPAACAALGVTIFPPVYAQLSAFSRDTAYVSFSLLTFAALGKVVRTPERSGMRWLGVALLCSSLATVSRQNGLLDIAVVVAFGLFHGRGVTLARGATALLAGLVAAITSYGLIAQAGSALGARSVHPERVTYIYDLAALSVYTDRNLFPVSQLRRLGPGGAAPTDLSLAQMRKEFRPFNVLTLAGMAQMDITNARVASRENLLLRSAWVRAVTTHPTDYLIVRGRLMLVLLGLGDPGPDVPLYQPDFAYAGLHTYGAPLNFQINASRAGVVLGWFLGPGAAIPLDRPWVYILAGSAAMIVIWRRRARTTLLAGCLMSATLLNLVVLFFTAMAAGFRYDNMVPPSVILVILYAMAGAGARDAGHSHLRVTSSGGEAATCK